MPSFRALEGRQAPTTLTGLSLRLHAIASHLKLLGLKRDPSRLNDEAVPGDVDTGRREPHVELRHLDGYPKARPLRCLSNWTYC